MPFVAKSIYMLLSGNFVQFRVVSTIALDQLGKFLTISKVGAMVARWFSVRPDPPKVVGSSVSVDFTP